jgi:hypothetical protein
MENNKVTLWYALRNYTELFCHIKRMSHFQNDERINPMDRKILWQIDNTMREASFVGGIAGGFTTTIVIS